MRLDPGARLGPYEILGPLGAGGMGEVYRARDTRLGRDVAIKVLPEIFARDPERLSRFEREARLLATLNHPNIAAIYGLEEVEGRRHIVLECVEGITLAERLRSGALPEEEALALAIQIAEALQEAHERGVIHRDLKPGNAVVTPKGRVKVLDFGLAKLLQPIGDLTQTDGWSELGSTGGTLPYMSPEQLLGHDVDARADIYALGVVLYEMVAGRRPFAAAVPALLTDQILRGSPDPPRTLRPGISVRTEEIILKCLEKDPARRYRLAEDLLVDLRRAAAPSPIERWAEPAGEDRAGRRIESLAVLPLDNLSGDPEQEFFADGMTEELIASLAQIGALRVISRTTVMRYKGSRKPLPEIARELRVQAVVEGSVRRAGSRVRITAQLLEAETDRHLWAKSYEGDLADVLSLQGEVAQAIAREIQVKLAPPEQARLAAARTVHPEAYEAYLRGRFYANKRTEGDLRRGIEFFTRAIELDPLYARGHVGLADAYNLLGYHEVLPPREVFPRAKAAANRALELDESLGEAHVSLAYGYLYFDWDWTAAKREFLRGIELNESYPQGHLWYANYLACMGELEQAETQVRRSLELDPLSLIHSQALCWVQFFARRFAEAVEQGRRTLALDPGYVIGYWWLGWSHALAGQLSEAARDLEQAASLSGRHPPIVAALGFVAARQGRCEAARATVEELVGQARSRYISSYDVAIVHTALGEHDAAFEWLGRSLEERSHLLTFLRIDPRLDPLREDPRYKELMAHVGHVARV